MEKRIGEDGVAIIAVRLWQISLQQLHLKCIDFFYFDEQTDEVHIVPTPPLKKALTAMMSQRKVPNVSRCLSRHGSANYCVAKDCEKMPGAWITACPVDHVDGSP